MDRIGRGVLRRHRLGARAHRHRARREGRARGASRRARKWCARSRRRPPSASRRASRRRRPRSRRASASRRRSRCALFERPGSTRTAAAVAARRPAAARRRLFRRGARGHVAAGRAQAAGLRRRGRGGRGAPGPGDHALRAAARAGREGQPDQHLAKDLARALSAISVRVVEVIPGKSTMGLEIPNEKREIVTLGEIIKSKAYDDMASPLALALGKDIGGNPVVADLARMPHLLIAGTTGSGKSVGSQRDGAVAALQVDGRARAPDHDRPEDAGALGLRGHPAPAGAGRHRHEAGGQRAALVRGRDGAPLPADGRAGRAQPRGLQPQGQGGGRRRASRCATRSR